MVSYECRNCKATNYFNPDPEVQLLMERKEPEKTFEIKSDELKRKSPKTYTLVCSQCHTVNNVTY